MEREPRSLSEQAYQKLVRMITRIEIAPGSLIVEKSLIAAFGIGRTPVREALQRAAIEGLVVHQPNRGMFAAEITATGVSQIYEFRSMIDRHLASLAATRATSGQVRQLQELHKAFATAIETQNIDDYVDLDRQFYALLCSCARNVYLAEVVPRIFNLHLRLWFYMGLQRDDWGDIWEAHESMVGKVSSAIAARDAQSAEIAIQNYVEERHRDLLELLVGDL